MSIQVTPLKAMRIGCDNVVWTQLTTDNETTLSYGTIYNLPGVMQMSINPNMSIETAYYDDGPGDVATTLGNIEITFNKSTLGLKEQAYLLGSAYVLQSLTLSGGATTDVYELLSGVTDTPPWGAIGFRTLKSDGSYKYIWLYKGKFTIPEVNAETKADTINFQSDEITARFIPLTYKFALTNSNAWNQTLYASKILNPWKAEWDETSVTDPTILAKIKGAWFSQVITPSYDATI